MNESASDNWIRAIVPFVVMCFGGFMALLDIQIVASSLQNIGGGLSAAQDENSWVQTAYLIAEIIVIPLSGWLTRVFSTRWRSGRLNDPDRIHIVVALFPGTAPRLFGGRGRHHRLGRSDTRPDHRRLDHRHFELALAVLC